MNKKMQTLIGKEATFPEGIDALCEASAAEAQPKFGKCFSSRSHRS